MIRIHKSCRELKHGSFRRMKAPPKVLAYGRFDENAATFIVVNNTDENVIVDDQVWYMGVPRNCIMKRLMLTNKDGYTADKQEYPVVMGRVSVTVPAVGAVILRYTVPRSHFPEVTYGSSGSADASGTNGSGVTPENNGISGSSGTYGAGDDGFAGAKADGSGRWNS